MAGQFPILTQFGRQDQVEYQAGTLDEARVFFTALYGHPDFDSLDSLREKLFASSRSDLRALPPTEDAFYFQAVRALYQIALYNRANRCHLHLPPPTDFGRDVQNGSWCPS